MYRLKVFQKHWRRGGGGITPMDLLNSGCPPERSFFPLEKGRGVKAQKKAQGNCLLRVYKGYSDWSNRILISHCLDFNTKRYLCVAASLQEISVSQLPNIIEKLVRTAVDWPNFNSWNALSSFFTLFHLSSVHLPCFLPESSAVRAWRSKNWNRSVKLTISRWKSYLLTLWA